LAVLVDKPVAAAVSSDRSAGTIFDDSAIVGRTLAESAVRSAGVVVRDVLVEEPFELNAVPDEGAVEKVRAHRSHPTFRVRVRDRRLGRGADDRRPFASEHLVEPGVCVPETPFRAWEEVCRRSFCGVCWGVGRVAAGVVLDGLAVVGVQAAWRYSLRLCWVDFDGAMRERRCGGCPFRWFGRVR
jgi:hypothetical protein